MVSLALISLTGDWGPERGGGSASGPLFTSYLSHILSGFASASRVPLVLLISQAQRPSADGCEDLSGRAVPFPDGGPGFAIA